MSAGQEISINKLAIIAGNGTLPRDLYQRATSLGIECHVIGFKGHTNYITPDFWGTIGKASKILAYLKKHKIQDIVFIGGIDKPNLMSLRLDWVTIKFFIKTWIKSFGDNNVLTSARKELENIGFHLHGIHQFLPELLLPEGLLGTVQIQDSFHNDIILGVHEALEWGEKDKGQSVLVKNGQVIAREGNNGTNKMIETYGEQDAILVKMCKPQQDNDLDLPTIGPKTIQACADKKMAGIIGHAGHMLVAERDDVIQLANQHNIFICGQVVENAHE